MSVADYCHDYNNKKIIVNLDYQRKEGLWTSQARSFFIESILLEYPIPKLYLYARLDLKSRQTIKEIVDGQQRSQALVGFFNGKQRLTQNIDTPELRGLKYSQLHDDWKHKFLSYSLPIDQFVGAPEDEIREAFRRMNANNVPLNDEEQRNARYQGPFKWFIIQIAEEYKDAFFKIGLFSRRDLIRMSDLKMYAELALTIESGFHTVKGKQLDDLYRKYNGTFPHEGQYGELIRAGLNAFFQREELQRNEFLRAHIFQSLVLAVLAVERGGRFSEQADAGYPEIVAKVQEDPVSLDVLAAALRDPEAYESFNEFIQASMQKTNVEDSRATRFIYFREALKAAA